MALIEIYRGAPLFLEEQRFANNGQLPSGGGFRRIVSALNHIAALQRRLTVIHAVDLVQVPMGDAGTRDWWRGLLRTGEDAFGLLHIVGLAKTTYEDAVDPHVTIRTETVAGVEVITQELHYPAKNLATFAVAPSEINHTSAMVLSGIDPDTEYSFILDVVDGARPVYWAVAELPADGLPESDTIQNPAPYSNDAPIYYQDIAKALRAANTIWKHNAGHLFSWSRKGPTSQDRETTSASYQSLAFTGAVPPDPTTPGWSFDLGGRGRKGNIPIVFAARGRTITGSGSANNIRLVDQDGTVIATLSSFPLTVAIWKTVAATIPDSTTRLHVEFRSDGTQTFQCNGVSVYQYEA